MLSQLDALRSHRVMGLLGELRAKQAKITELGARRKVNQRTLCDAALDKRCAQEAQRRLNELREVDRSGWANEAPEREAALTTELEKARAMWRAAQEEVARLKAIAEPAADYFMTKGAYSLAVDLAIAESITKAHVARNQVPSLFLIFARLFRVKLPTHKSKVPFKRVEGKMTYVERELLYVPSRTHVKEVCATLNAAHKLQIGTQLLETSDGYCYTSDGAESLQSEWLAQLLSRRGADGKLHTTALDLSLLHSKTSEAQLAAFQASLKSVAELCRDVGVTDEVSPRLLDFKPSCTMNDRAAPARKASRLVRGVADGNDDPTCAHHGVTNIFEEGRKAIDCVLREMMHITDEQAASVAAKVKAMRTCVGWFSSPACSLIYQVHVTASAEHLRT